MEANQNDEIDDFPMLHTLDEDNGIEQRSGPIIVPRNNQQFPRARSAFGLLGNWNAMNYLLFKILNNFVP